MAAEVMAAVRRTHPHLELLVAGQLPSGVSPGQAWPGVRLLGRVDDLASAYARSAFVLAPLTAGGGGRIKVIEALASGVPVITTSLGASGLPGEVAAHLWVADDVAGLAEAVADVVADPIAAGETAETGRRLVEASLGEEAMARRWARLVNSVAENRSVSNNP
jgi:glycosyltransferase involved in cell wall biosynthesis